MVQAAHRRSWCFCVWRSWCFFVCGVWLALELVRIRREMKRGTAFSYSGPQSWSACACVCAYASTSPAGCWREASRTLVGRANSRTGGGQTKVQRWRNKVDLRVEWPLQGIQSEKVGSGRCSPISTNHVALFGLSCTRLGLVSALHLSLAIFQQGAPCFGHCPDIYIVYCINAAF